MIQYDMMLCVGSMIFVTTLCSPNEDLGRLNKRSVVSFRGTFNVSSPKSMSTRFGRRVIENSFKNAHATLCSVFPNLRLGSIQLPDRVTRVRVPCN